MSDGFGRTEYYRCRACGERFPATVWRGMVPDDDELLLCDPCETYRHYELRDGKLYKRSLERVPFHGGSYEKPRFDPQSSK